MSQKYETNSADNQFFILKDLVESSCLKIKFLQKITKNLGIDQNFILEALVKKLSLFETWISPNIAKHGCCQSLVKKFPEEINFPRFFETLSYWVNNSVFDKLVQKFLCKKSGSTIMFFNFLQKTKKQVWRRSSFLKWWCDDRIIFSYLSTRTHFRGHRHSQCIVRTSNRIDHLLSVSNILGTVKCTSSEMTPRLNIEHKLSFQIYPEEVVLI